MASASSEAARQDAQWQAVRCCHCSAHGPCPYDQLGGQRFCDRHAPLYKPCTGLAGQACGRRLLHAGGDGDPVPRLHRPIPPHRAPRSSSGSPSGATTTPPGAAAKQKEHRGLIAAVMAFFAFHMRAELEAHEGPPPTAEQAQAAYKANLETTVLATIACGGWRTAWCKAVLMLVIGAYSSCHALSLVAVRGRSRVGGRDGNARGSPGHPGLFRPPQPDAHGLRTCTATNWVLARQGAPALTLLPLPVRIHRRDQRRCQLRWPTSGGRLSCRNTNSAAPNLARGAVVSLAALRQRRRQRQRAAERPAERRARLARGQRPSERLGRPAWSTGRSETTNDRAKKYFS